MVNAKLGKRKRDTAEQVNGKSKLQEYLHVMQAPSKSKLWSNEDLVRPQGAAHSTLGSPQLNTIGEHVNGDYETVQKKLKSAIRPNQDRELLYSSEENHTTATMPMPQSNVLSEAPSLPLDQGLPITSDGDWLRSRASDLVEADRTDDAMPPKVSPGTDILAQESITAHQLPRGIISDLSIQAEAASGSQLSTPTIVSGHATGRLFVRNLAYASTEDELREYFTSQGSDSIQEVRSIASFHVFIYMFWQIFMMNILIGTTYVQHMMLPGRVF